MSLCSDLPLPPVVPLSSFKSRFLSVMWESVISRAWQEESRDVFKTADIRKLWIVNLVLPVYISIPGWENDQSICYHQGPLDFLFSFTTIWIQHRRWNMFPTSSIFNKTFRDGCVCFDKSIPVWNLLNVHCASMKER